MNEEIDKNIKTSSTSKVMELDDLTDNLDNNLVLENFGKKKKKKKPTFDLEDIERVMTNNNEMSLDNEETTTVDNADNVVDISLDIDFSMAKKKRKPKKNQKIELIDLLMDKVADDDDDDDEEDFGDKNKENEQQHGSNLNGQEETANIDYTYEELLKRAFDMMLQYNPDMASGRRAKFVMRPPHVIRIGTKKTSFVNFIDIAKTLHRVPKHLLDFVLAELGTSGSMDGTMQLIIKGRFQAKQIENVLRRYIKEYVTCHTCRSPDTLLQKETRLYFLKCETCGSRCSVASIKSGFQAVTSKRAAIRAKTN